MLRENENMLEGRFEGRDCERNEDKLEEIELDGHMNGKKNKVT